MKQSKTPEEIVLGHDPAADWRERPSVGETTEKVEARRVALERLVRVRELRPQPNGVYLCNLPDGFVLINPTETELAIVEIYARECERIRPSLTAECQHPNNPVSDPAKPDSL